MSRKRPALAGGRESLRLALRIARRDAAQHRGRSALIIALIALPIIALSGLATIEASSVATPQETIRDALGNTQASLTMVGAPDPTLVQDPLDPTLYGTSRGDGFVNSATPPVSSPSAYLPAGTRILTIRRLAVTATTATGIGSLAAVEGEPWNSAFAGRYAVLSGRRPTSDTEVMVTPAALRRLGSKIGSSLELTEPRAGSFTIVGTMRDLTDTNSSQTVFARPGALDGITPAHDLVGTTFFLPDRALSWPQVRALNRDGITVLSRAVLLNPPPPNGIGDSDAGWLTTFQSSLILLPLVGFSLFEVALLAGAAFMVGTRQQQRGLATLASVGGDRRMLSRVVSSAGLVLGLAGGLVGTAVGAGVAWLYMRWTTDGGTGRYPGFHVDPIIATAIVLFAVIAGWISALVPARRAGRIDVVASLRGASRPQRPSKRAPILGIIIGIGGAAITAAGAVALIGLVASDNHQTLPTDLTTTAIVVGPILLQIAALILTPLLLRAVARPLGRLGTAARLASRDTARNASRSVPAVGAIMSTVFVASFVITYLAAAQASTTATYEYATAPGIVSYPLAELHPTAQQVAAVRESMTATLGTPTTRVLSSADEYSESAKPGELFALPALDPAARCTELPAGPTPVKAGSLSIIDPNCQGPGYLTFPTESPHIWVASPTAIAMAVGAPLDARSLAAYDSGKAVAFYPEYVRNGTVTINWWTAKQLARAQGAVIAGSAAKTVSLDAVLQKPPHAVQFDLVISPATARAAGIQYGPAQLIAHSRGALSDTQRDALTAGAQAVFGGGASGYFSYEGGPQTFAGPAQWALLALCALIALGAAAVALGLARAEGRRDTTVLGSLGAPPRLHRAFGFWSASVIAGVGSVGGVLLGTVPAIAIAGPLTQPSGLAATTPFEVPWLVLGLAAVGIPLILAVGSWLTSGRGRVQYNVRTPIG